VARIHIVSLCGGKWGIVGLLNNPIPDPNGWMLKNRKQ